MNTILKEVRVILPETDPEGFMQEDIHQNFEEELIKHFQSFSVTLTESFAQLNDKECIHDNALMYDVVLTDTVSAVEKLKELTNKTAKALGQTYYYLKNTSGEVYFFMVV